MTPRDRLRQQILRKVREQAPDLAVYVAKAFDQIADDIPIGLLTQFIETGDVEGLLLEVFDDAFFEKALADVQRAFFGQAAANVDYFSRNLGVAFGTLNPRVIDSIRKLNIEMAQSFGDEVRETVRAFIENGLRDGVNPRTIARQTRQVVGLTEKQVDYVANLRRELENNSRAALRRALGRGLVKKPDGSIQFVSSHAGGIGVRKKDLEAMQRVLGTKDRLSPQQIDRIVDAYQRRLTAWHSETIARTNTLRSLGHAQHEATQQAIDQGILDGTRMMKEWVTAGDSRVRPEHQLMGRSDPVPFNQTFSNGDNIPGENDYNCRCIARYYLARKP